MDFRHKVMGGRGALQSLAGAIPGYNGYKQKELRRDADKLIRAFTADKLSEQRRRVTDLQATLARTGQLAAVGSIERLNAKFNLLIDSIRTASYGYAGWFDSITINEEDLDTLYDFDASLAEGVEEITGAVNALQEAVSSRSNIEAAVDTCAKAIDDMNERFKHRQEYVIEGKRVQAQFPTDLLKAKPKTTPEAILLWNLRPKDAVSVADIDYLIEGRVATSQSTNEWRRYLLKDGEKEHWLWIGDAGATIALLHEVSPPAGAANKDALTFEGMDYRLDFESADQVDVEGASGKSGGNYVRVRRFLAGNGSLLWLENWGTETKAMSGEPVSQEEVKVWKK